MKEGNITGVLSSAQAVSTEQVNLGGVKCCAELTMVLWDFV